MIENSIVYRDLRGKYKFLPISKAEGSLIWDRDGKRYIDFTSGWNVTNLGWNNQEINQAIIDQTNVNVQSLLWGSVPIQEEYAKALTDTLPDGLDACVKATGGTEAIESSIKIARSYTGRKKIIGFNNHYHGQLFASLALGAPEKSREIIAPLVPEIKPIEYPHQNFSKQEYEKFLIDLENKLKNKDVAAVVTEPGIITGWGSTLIAYPGFLIDIRRLTKQYDTLLIVDEVGTGFSRTGKLFGIEHDQVVPDMIVFAKGISNGASAIGTTVGRSEVFKSAFTDAMLISTFGWTPIACAAALKTLQIHQREKTWELAEKKGQYIQKKLKNLIGNKVVDVRGQGMEIGLQFKDSNICQEVQQKTFSQGLHVVVGSEDNMQIMPPLTIPVKLIDEGLEILFQALK